MEPYQNDFSATIVIPENATEYLKRQLSALSWGLLSNFNRVQIEHQKLLNEGRIPGRDMLGILRVVDELGCHYDKIFSDDKLAKLPRIKIVKRSDVKDICMEDEWLVFVFLEPQESPEACGLISTKVHESTRVIHLVDDANSVTRSFMRNGSFCLRYSTTRIDDIMFVVGEIISAFMYMQFCSVGINEICTTNNSVYDFMIFKGSIDEHNLQKINRSLDVFAITRFDADNFDSDIFDSVATALCRSAQEESRVLITDNTTLETSGELIIAVIFSLPLECVAQDHNLL